MAAIRKRFVPQDSSRRRIWVYVAVAAFVVLDVVLIVWALNSTAAAAGHQSAGPTIASDRPTPSTTPGPASEPVEAPLTTVAPTRLLAALDGTTAWRATTGACPVVLAEPELTTDGGASWKVTDAADAEVTALQDIIVETPQIASFLGFSSDDCSPQGVRTFVAGDDYAPYPALVSATWHIDPADRASITAPGGATAAPCPTPLAIASRDEAAAAVLCADQSIHATEDGGRSWSASTEVLGALNLTETESGYIALAAGVRECAGVQVMSLDASLARGTTECLPLDLVTSTLQGAVAVAQALDTIWVWVGDRVWRSGDGGATWQ